MTIFKHFGREEENSKSFDAPINLNNEPILNCKVNITPEMKEIFYNYLENLREEQEIYIYG